MFTKHSARILGFTLALATLFLFALRFTSTDRPSPPVVDGYVDLTGWDFDRYGPARLDGLWEFSWGKAGLADRSGPFYPDGLADRYPVPALWQKPTALGKEPSPRGEAVYRLRARLDPALGPYAMYVAGALSVCRVFVDGRFVGDNGTIDETGREIPLKHLIMPAFVPSGPETEITLDVVNQDNSRGGLNESILIAPRDRLNTAIGLRWLIGACMAGAIFAIGAYHCIIFSLRRNDRSNLFFGLLAVVWSMAILFSPHSAFVISAFTRLSWGVYVKLALLPYAAAIPLMVALYHSLFPKRYGLWVDAFYALLGGVFAVAILASGPSAFGGIPLMYYLVTRTAYLYLFAAFAVDIRRRERGAPLLVPGYLALAYGELVKMLYNQHVIASDDTAPYGMLLFILSYAVFMAVRFSQTCSNAELLADELRTGNARLERLSRLKDLFLANATHELKTPLAGMVGVAESLLGGTDKGMSDATRASLGMLAYSGKRLSRLVDDVLDHDRLENKDVRLQLETIRLELPARRVLAMAAILARDKGLELRDGLPQDLPPVLADAARLEQILFNLTGNAIKYTKEGFVELSAAVRGEWMEVRVADSGMGIAPEDHERIFKSFTQGLGHDASPEGGVGLGLAIAKNLVTLHGGTIHVDSQPGRGSVFRFTLPLSKDKIAPVRDQTPAPLVPGPEIPPLPPESDEPRYDVLVVDDEPVNLHVAAACLSLAGLTVKTARSGEQALAMLAAGDDPAVALLDVMLPDQDGYAVCREMRRSRNAASLPVVMLTCRTRLEDVVEGFAAGANDYVTKPFSREELVARVRTQRDLRRAYRTLEENAALRREAAMRRKTEQELRLRQIRLSRMLDAIDEAVVAVNQSREIAFCNLRFAALCGKPAEELLGLPLSGLFASPQAPAVARLMEGLGRMLDDDGKADDFGLADLAREGEAPLSCRILATLLDLEEEPLALLRLHPKGEDRPHDADAFVDMLRKVEGNRLRLQRIGEALQTMPDEAGQAVVREDLGAIGALLENIRVRIIGEFGEEEARPLAVQVMRTALDRWTEATGLGKGELALQSGLWNAYMERDGYLRTQTLDKYLSLATLPRRPRWRSVIATAEFALSACPDAPSRDDALRRGIERLRGLGNRPRQ